MTVQRTRRERMCTASGRWGVEQCWVSAETATRQQGLLNDAAFFIPETKMIVEDRDKPRRFGRVLPLRVLIPNAVTALALCIGLTAVRFAIGGEWEKAVTAIIIAGVLDGTDGRIARLLKGQSRFGAELDSLSDVIAFGVSPAIIIYLWSLQHLDRFGWIFALAHAVDRKSTRLNSSH